MAAREAWIIDTARTPRGIGKVGKGSLAHLHPQHLGATVLKALRDRNDIDTSEIDDVVWGTSSQRGKQGADLGRMSLLLAGYDTAASGVTLDRFCGSGITSVNMAAASIMSGMEDLVIGGGCEMMSFTSSTAQGGGLLDAGNMALRELHPQWHQGICADLIATLEGVTREDVDKIGFESQRRAKIAMDEGRFDRSVVPVYNEDGSLALDHDEFPRPQTTMEGLAQLPAVFENFMPMPVDESGLTFDQLVKKVYPDVKINHMHHAGNSSGVVDGSGAVLLCSPEYAKARGWKPRAKIVAMANAAGSPELMLNEPGPAARKVVKRAGMTLDDIDLFEINEAFAVVAFKFMRDLGLDPEKCNVNGGSIALGHPIGATGSILIGTVLDELERQDKSTGLVTMCAAGGMAPAIIIERI
ncbi:MAG TPA: acetyl-CoA C-acetyltransferase [Pseudomonadales bacterium]|nr:acetyl-CoA C-acetyltransferase [Pseudomonadales bacterium]